MGSWNTGPFDNDAAADLLEEISDLPGDQRSALLADQFERAVESPDGPVEKMYPSEVVAGAALVALALPGGDRVLRWQEVDVSEELSEAALDSPDRALVGSALDALRAVTDPQRD